MCKISVIPFSERHALKHVACRVLEWDPDDPEDRTKWFTQHNGLLNLDPPYVYHTVCTRAVSSSRRALTETIVPKQPDPASDACAAGSGSAFV